MKRITRIGIIGAAAAATIVTLGAMTGQPVAKDPRAQQPSEGDGFQPSYDYHSGYIPQGIFAIDGQTIYSIDWTYNGDTDNITFDPNRCSIDQYGEPQNCTRMAPIVFDFTVTFVSSEAAPNGLTNYLYSLSASGYDGPALTYVLNGSNPAIGGQYASWLLISDGSGGTAAIQQLQLSATSAAEIRPMSPTKPR